MRKCSRCQEPVDPDTQRCPHCGAWLSDQADPPEPNPESLEDTIRALLARRQKIAAIKLYREQTHVGLKEAKDAVEALAAQNGIMPPPRSGCFAVLALLVFGMSLVTAGWLRWR